jgi:hypothetical protein
LESVKEDISNAPENEDQGKTVYFMIGLALATVVVSIFVFALTMSKRSQITSLGAQIEEEVTVPLNNLAKERKQVVAVTGQLDILNTALSSRIKHGQTIKDLALNTHKQTRWSSLDYGEEGQIVLTGVADDFANVSKVVSAFENFKTVKSVDLSSVSVDESSGSVQYILDITLDESGYKILNQKKTSTKAGL